MPRKSNKQADLSAVLDTNPVLDMDNVYWSKLGWAYRHYKADDKSRYWDEILVAGEALLDNGNPDTTADEFGAASPTFESGDSLPSVEVPKIESFEVSGSATATAAAIEAGYEAALDGDNLTSATYSWTSTDASAVFSAATAAATSITFSEAGTYTVTCSVEATEGGVTVNDSDSIEVVVEPAA